MECELSVFSVVDGAAVVLVAGASVGLDDGIFAENACLLTALVDSARVVTATSLTLLSVVVVDDNLVSIELVVVDVVVVVVEVELVGSTC